MSDDPNQQLDRLLAITLVQQIQIELLLALVDEVGKKAGVTRMGDLTLRDWFERRKHEEIDRELIRMEDQDPSVAAALQEIIDKSRKRPEEL